MSINPYEVTATDNQSGRKRRQGHRGIFFYLSYLSVIAVWTVYAIFRAELDRSYLALAIAILVGPSVNGFLALCGSVFVFVRRSSDAKYPVSLWFVVGFAFLSTLVILVSVFSMRLHGS